MSTTQLASTLFQVQELDLELDRIAAEQQSINSTLQGNKQLQRLRADYAIAQQELQAAQQSQREAEWALEDVNRRLTAQEQRLFSGAVTTPKELNSLQQEVQRLRAQQSRQEELVLEMIDAAEALKETDQRKSAALRQAEEAWQLESATLIARRDQLEARKSELQSKRSRLSNGIAPEVMQRYESMRRSKQGRAISRVDHNSCQWCRVILTASELQRVRISPELQTCTNCGRILYYDR